MSDEEFVEAFESCVLPNEMFRHREHLRLAWIYLRRYGSSEAHARVAESIRTYAEHLGAIHKYHETVTQAWLCLVANADNCLPEAASIEDILAAFPDLLDKSVLRRYYSSALLESDAARIEFVEPDLEPLPPWCSGGC